MLVENIETQGNSHVCTARVKLHNSVKFKSELTIDPSLQVIAINAASVTVIIVHVDLFLPKSSRYFIC